MKPAGGIAQRLRAQLRSQPSWVPVLLSPLASCEPSGKLLFILPTASLSKMGIIIESTLEGC